MAHPALATRVGRLLAACRGLATLLPETGGALLHRDFYPDQVLMDGERVWLLDLDLCALGDPCLDHGNFLAHLVERALRRPGCSSALEACAGAYLEAACSLTGPGGRRRIEAYLTLSLARHVGLSTQLEGRGDTTLPLLELCERRLAAEAVPLETEERTHP